MTYDEVLHLVKIGFCQPKNYKQSVWRKAKAVMEKACELGLARPFDYGRGKGKYTTDLEIDEVAKQLFIQGAYQLSIDFTASAFDLLRWEKDEVYRMIENGFSSVQGIDIDITDMDLIPVRTEGKMITFRAVPTEFDFN